jgi:hypothetical protein
VTRFVTLMGKAGGCRHPRQGAVVHLPVPQSLTEWFASLTGKVLATDKLAAEREAEAKARREAEAEPTPRVA